MTAASQPLVAFVCRAPVLSEALAASLALVADVRSFPAGRPDPEGLIRALRPDALVVDDGDEAERLAPYARGARTPLVLIAARPTSSRARTGRLGRRRPRRRHRRNSEPARRAALRRARAHGGSTRSCPTSTSTSSSSTTATTRRPRRSSASRALSQRTVRLIHRPKARARRRPRRRGRRRPQALARRVAARDGRGPPAPAGADRGDAGEGDRRDADLVLASRYRDASPEEGLGRVRCGSRALIAMARLLFPTV